MLPVITWNKKFLKKRVVPVTYTLQKKFFAAATFEGLRVVSLQAEQKKNL